MTEDQSAKSLNLTWTFMSSYAKALLLSIVTAFESPETLPASFRQTRDKNRPDGSEAFLATDTSIRPGKLPTDECFREATRPFDLATVGFLSIPLLPSDRKPQDSPRSLTRPTAGARPTDMAR